MKVSHAGLEGVLVIEPRVFEDARGYFFETFRIERYREAGIDSVFTQDNVSYSAKNALRGLHFQHPHDQAKLVQVIRGEIFDVAVDIRKSSPTFGRWFGAVLSEGNHRQLFVPVGFAHGFCVLSDEAHVTYKCSDIYSPSDEGGILWSDPDIAIDWPVASPLLSPKDTQFPRLKDIPSDRLPQ
ncbi:MAG: dTDP-4-dehydrorhamnose 3,5-epimerase [Desulfobacterales bacterium]|jgi:dTDP-4-dehydrorhamnose 3,5-epimerase